MGTACALVLACAAAGAQAADPRPGGSSHREPGVRFVITSGDTLSHISQQFLVASSAWTEVAHINHLADPHRLRPGQTLWIPARLMRSGSQPAMVTAASGPVRVITATGELPVSAGQALLVGQELVTGALATATLRLGDGSLVEIQPGSRTQVTANRVLPTSTRADAPSLFISGLRLLQGSIEVLATKVLRATPLAVETPTAVIGVRGTRYRVHADGSAYPTRAEVLEGRVAVDQGQRVRDLPVDALQGAAMAPQRAPQVVRLPAAPQVTLPDTVCAGRDWRITPDSANPPSPIAASQIVISRDPQAHQIVSVQRVAQGQSYAVPADLPPGPWYATVISVNDLGLLGLSRSLQFVAAPPERCAPAAPEGIDPAPSVRWLSSTLSLQVDVPTAAQSAQPAQVVIARDPDFRQPLFSQTTASPRWIIGAPGTSGTLYVRYQRAGHAPSAVARVMY
ncbi:FecR domain-containing protein [Amphibiibacter pelophylacis]|uniref:FecR domain-containing protein n=1 Tax=Amphibiibacter pelophylacis TaxID=1799477 RepID=A0ACC6P4H6_9BURK